MFEMCKNGRHDLVEILRTTPESMGDMNIESVVRWCQNCGAIVVDSECDMRLYAGELKKLTCPKVAHEYVNKFSQEK